MSDSDGVMLKRIRRIVPHGGDKEAIRAEIVAELTRRVSLSDVVGAIEWTEEECPEGIELIGDLPFRADGVRLSALKKLREN